MKKHFFVYSLVLSILAISIFWYMNFGKEKNIFEVKADWNWAWPIVWSDLFYNFFSWKKWNIKDFDPLYILIKSQVSKSLNIIYPSPSNYPTTTNFPNVLTDVNWDWLPDLVINDYKEKSFRDSNGDMHYQFISYYALLLNKWNIDFEVKYRCVYHIDNAISSYYWDCVQ